MNSSRFTASRTSRQEMERQGDQDFFFFACALRTGVPTPQLHTVRQEARGAPFVLWRTAALSTRSWHALLGHCPEHIQACRVVFSLDMYRVAMRETQKKTVRFFIWHVAAKNYETDVVRHWCHHMLLFFLSC